MTARLAPLDNFYVKSQRELLQKEIMTQFKWYQRSGLALIDRHLELLRRDHRVRGPRRIEKKAEEKLPKEPERKPALIEVAQSKKQLQDIAKIIIRNEPVDESQMPAHDPEIRALLYQGVSANGEGRISYLKARNRLAPIMRYTFSPLTLWTHGWMQDKFPKERMPMSDFPLPHRLKAVFRKNGLLHPDDAIYTMGCKKNRNWL